MNFITLEQVNKAYKKMYKNMYEDVKMVLKNKPNTTYSDETRMKFNDESLSLKNHYSAHPTLFEEVERIALRVGSGNESVLKYIKHYEETSVKQHDIVFASRDQNSKLITELSNEGSWIELMDLNAAALCLVFNRVSYHKKDVLTETPRHSYYKRVLVKKESQYYDIYLKTVDFFKHIQKILEGSQFINPYFRDEKSMWQIGFVYRNIPTNLQFYFNGTEFIFSWLDMNDDKVVFSSQSFNIRDLNKFDLCSIFDKGVETFVEAHQLEFLLNPNLDYLVEKAQEKLDSSVSDKTFRKEINVEGFKTIIRNFYEVEELYLNSNDFNIKHDYLFGMSLSILEFEGKMFIIDNIEKIREFHLIHSQQDIVDVIQKQKEVLIKASIASINTKAEETIKKLSDKMNK